MCLSAQLDISPSASKNCIVSICTETYQTGTQVSPQRPLQLKRSFILKKPKRLFSYFYQLLCFFYRKGVSLWDKATLIWLTAVWWQRKWYGFQIGFRYSESYYRRGRMTVTASEPRIMGYPRDACLMCFAEACVVVIFPDYLLCSVPQCFFDAVTGGHFHAHLMCFSNLISSLTECYANESNQRLHFICSRENVYHFSA